MTYDTRNAVPSKDPRDLDDNAQALDRFLQSNASAEPDRLGVMRKTWHQLEVEAAELVLNLSGPNGARGVGGLTANVATVAELRNYPKTSAAKSVRVAGNGIDRLYRQDSADTTSTDTGSGVIVAADGMRWKLVNPSTNSPQHYAEYGAVIHSFGDRLFVGGATLNDGKNQPDQPDWLTQAILDLGRTFAFQQPSQAAILTGESRDAANGLLVGARTSKFETAGYGGIGLVAVGLNDNTSLACGAWGGYFEGIALAGASGPTYGVEIDAINFGTSGVTDPYQQAVDQVVGLQIASAAEFDDATASSAAINIRNNGNVFSYGIVFGKDSIAGADGTTGTGVAIAMGKGHQIGQFTAAGVLTSFISFETANLTACTRVAFPDNQMRLRNSADKNVFQVSHQPGDVNYLSMRASAPAAPVQIQAAGDDTNVDIQFAPKGSGRLWLGPYTATLVTPTGYIEMKNAAGALVRVPCQLV